MRELYGYIPPDILMIQRAPPEFLTHVFVVPEFGAPEFYLKCM